MRLVSAKGTEAIVLIVPQRLEMASLQVLGRVLSAHHPSLLHVGIVHSRHPAVVYRPTVDYTLGESLPAEAAAD